MSATDPDTDTFISFTASFHGSSPGAKCAMSSVETDVSYNSPSMATLCTKSLYEDQSSPRSTSELSLMADSSVSISKSRRSTRPRSTKNRPVKLSILKPLCSVVEKLRM